MTRPTSYAPIVLGSGVMLALWGAATTWIVSAAGLLVLASGRHAGYEKLDMKTDSPWLHRYAILVALCALIAIILGAIVTSLERPIAATLQPSSRRSSFEFWHNMAGGVAVVLDAWPGDWTSTQFGWIALAPGISMAYWEPIEAGHSLPQLPAFSTRCSRRSFFGSIVAIAVMTSASWKTRPRADRRHVEAVPPRVSSKAVPRSSCSKPPSALPTAFTRSASSGTS